MAQSKNTNKGKSKSIPAQKKTAAPPEPQPPRFRREIWAVVFLLLSGLLFISFFNMDGAFVAFFANLVKGFVGWGVWLAAPAFLMIAVVLLFHRGKPVGLRVSALFLLPLLFASMLHLLLARGMTAGMEFKELVNTLFREGRELACGGVLGGLLAEGLDLAFSVYGALPILLIFFVLFLLLGFRGNLSGILAVDKKERRKEKRDEDFFAEPEPAAPVKKAAKEKKTKEPLIIREEMESVSKPAFSVDLPLWEDGEEDAFFQKKPDGTAEAAVKDAPRRLGLRKKAQQEEEEELRPLPVHSSIPFPQEAEEEEEVLEPVRARSRPLTVSAEISDPPRGKKPIRSQVDAEAEAIAREAESFRGNTDYQFPPLSLLKSGCTASVDGREEILVNRERLEGALHSFGIGASIVGVTRGPTVTRFDVELEQGVKLARITNLAGDIALALGVVNVRIAPIPDKISTVGIEVPNKIVSTVYLRDIIASPQFAAAKSRLSIALGKDIGGDCVVGNIAKLPHLLIAGTTGSGKSVCMNSLILSLLYKAGPDEVRLIMIDPKMVELGIYNGIPHLYVPVVTDPKKAAGALQWSVVEMLKRYRMFSEKGVRDLASYNKLCADAGEQTLPQVVIVIDELADLMMVASKEVEESICRVAQMGRAAGMHLVIATQRPSADVITGLMKANIPSRIAFAVSSSMESRIILDQGGAEKLVGMGDMLFSPVGCGKPTRVQGAFVSDEEREEVIQFIKESAGSPQQNREIEEFMNKALESKSGDGGKGSKDDSADSAFDEMLPQAVDVVLEMGSCSVSMLQRRVKLGYSRAARIVDQMEELGIVGPYEGAKPRQVIVDRAGWQEIQARMGMDGDSPSEVPFDY